VVTPDAYGSLMPIGPQTHLFQSSVERQRRQAIELVRAQADVVRVAEDCRLELTLRAMGNVSNLLKFGEHLVRQNPSAAGQLELLINSYVAGASIRIAGFN
jgi:hypothetical protein